MLHYFLRYHTHSILMIKKYFCFVYNKYFSFTRSYCYTCNIYQINTRIVLTHDPAG